MPPLVPQKAPASTALWAIAVVAALVSVVVLAVGGGFVLTNDGPAHLFNAWGLQHIEDPAVGQFVQENPRIAWFGVPLVFDLLSSLLGWRAGWTGVAAAVALLYAVAGAAVVVALAGRRSPCAIAAAPLAFHHGLYIGLFHYELGVGLSLLGVAWWLRRRQSLVDHAVLCLLVTLAAFAHPFAAAIGGLTCIVVTLTERGDGLRRLLRLAVAGAPALVIALLSRTTTELAPDPDVWPGPLAMAKLVVGFMPGPALHGTLFWCIALAGGGAAIVWAPTKAGRVLALWGGLLLVATILGPRDYGGWQLVGIRPLPFAAVFLLAGVPWGRLPAPGRTVSWVGVVVLVVLSFATTHAVHERMRAVVDPVVERVSRLQREPAFRGAIVAIDAPAGLEVVPLWAPYLRAPQLAAVVSGGVAAYGLFGRAVDPLALNPVATNLPVPPQRLLFEGRPPGSPGRQAWLRRLAVGNVAIGNIVAFGNSADLDEIVAAGFVPTQRLEGDLQSPGVMLARFEGCAARFSLPQPTMQLRMGAAPDANAFMTMEVGSGDVIEGLVCGADWFEVTGASCAEADAHERLGAVLRRNAVVDVRCTAP